MLSILHVYERLFQLFYTKEIKHFYRIYEKFKSLLFWKPKIVDFCENLPKKKSLLFSISTVRNLRKPFVDFCFVSVR